VLKSLVENGPKATALLSFFVLMLTVFHDWGYFWIIGSKFQSLQTPYDYITNSITWLPLSLALLALYVGASGFIISQLISRRSTVEFDSQPPNLRRAWLRQQLYRLTMLCAGLTLVSGAIWYVTKFPIAPVFGACTFVSVYVMIACVFYARATRYEWSQAVVPLTALISFVPIIVGLSFMGGLVEALAALSSRQNVYALRQKAVPDKQVLLLRSLDKGALTYNLRDNKIAFTRWDDLVGIDHTFFPARREGSICNFTDHICNAAETP
jgi:hypothetical protein